MSGDDPRHGTAAGYSAHRRAGQDACGPCKDGRAAARQNGPKKPAKPRVRSTTKPRKTVASKSGYITNGYDPADGLNGGQWMRDTWGILRWVQVEQLDAHTDQPRTRACADCGEEVSKKALRCRPCSLERVRLTNRRYMRYARSKDVAA